MKSLLIVAAIGFAVACSNTNNVQESTSGEESVQLAEVTPNATSTLDVEGMTCEMGCKAAIEKHLSKTAGVATCKVDFESAVAVIEYDNNQITEDQIIAEIGSVANEAYSAKPHIELNESVE